MKKLLFLLMFISSATFAQNTDSFESGDLILHFNQSDFGDRFAVLADYEGNYNYYVTDLSKFSNRLEKIYFLNLIFDEHKIISIDSDLSKDQLWFKALVSIPENEIICLLDDNKKTAQQKVNAMTESEKAALLKKNEKFNGK